MPLFRAIWVDSNNLQFASIDCILCTKNIYKLNRINANEEQIMVKVSSDVNDTNMLYIMNDLKVKANITQMEFSSTKRRSGYLNP